MPLWYNHPDNQPKACLPDLQRREENENSKTQRGSVMKSDVRKHSKADDYNT